MVENKNIYKLECLSFEELRRLWDQADESDGWANGYPQGEIYLALLKKWEKEKAGCVKNQNQVRLVQNQRAQTRKRTWSPIDFSWGMKDISKRGMIIARSKQ